jgi:radical SAM PhpK family P-methyltransferase
MPSKSKINCVIVGYNDIDFQSYATAQKKMDKFSGAYRDIKHNSVRLNGRRMTYMELLNHGIKRATGHDPHLNAFEVPSLAVTYLASYLRRRNFSVDIVSFFNYEREKFAALLADSPTAVAITTTYYVDPLPVIEVVKFVREHSPETKIIVGGPHIFNISNQYNLLGHVDCRTQDFIFKSIGADIYVCDSQGEQTLALTLDLLRAERFAELRTVPNLVYTTDNTNFERTRRQVEDTSLDDNVADFSVFREEESNIFSYPVFLRTARSCPFACAFCNFPAVAGPHTVSGTDVMERQFRYLHERGVKHLTFIDDTFNVPLPRFKELLRMMIRNKFDFNWISFFRCSNADDETFDLIAESGCKEVFLGIESGDQQLLNNMRKFADISKYKYGIRKLNEHGIVSYASFITGFPGETRESVMRTVEFIEETRPSLYNIQMYYHDVRTPIHKQADEYQIHGAGYCWKHRTMRWEEAADWTDYQFSQIKNSIPTTIYGFSIWVLPYLISKGISMDRIKDFLVIAREMLVQSFDDQDRDFSDQENRLESLLRDCPVALPGQSEGSCQTP